MRTEELMYSNQAWLCSLSANALQDKYDVLLPHLFSYCVWVSIDSITDTPPGFHTTRPIMILTVDCFTEHAVTLFLFS